MKSYTDIEQSKKLFEILPIESADMAYLWHSTSDNPIWRYDEDMPPMVLGNVPINKLTCDTLPCWSLAALMDVLDLADLFKTPQGWVCQSYINFKAIISDYCDNPVDTCVKIILKLHEQKLL